MATVGLKQIIAELLDSQDRSEHYFRRLYRIGVQSARKFNLSITGQFRSVLLDVPANGVIPFPCDYLQYSTLGVIDTQGNVVALKKNENLSLLRQQYLTSQQQVTAVPQIPNVLSDAVQYPAGYPFYWLNYQWGGNGWVHLYGIGGGSATIGEFTVDEEQRCFFVPQYFPYTFIMLEYLSDGFDQNGQDYQIDVMAIEAIKDNIRWEAMRDLPKKYSRADVEYAKRQYLISRRDAKAMINHAHVTEMQVMFRSKVKLTAKA